MSNAVNSTQSLRPVPFEPAQSHGAGKTPAVDPDGLTFSKHLNERIERRQLEMTPERLTRLSDAVDKVAGKGSRDSVVLLDDLALLVNVPSRTVLTAIATARMKDGVFTNIDSVVLG
jgi:flagellar operon protein